MTARQDLEREREALVSMRDWLTGVMPATVAKRAALTASIERLDALLSLSDERANGIAGIIGDEADRWENDAADMGDDGASGCRDVARTLRTVADLVRRTP